MSDEVYVKYIYPPHFDGDTMTPPRRWTVELIGISDGSGETNVSKISLGNHLTQNGDIASYFIIEKINYQCTGFSSVKLTFDRTFDEILTVLGADSDGETDYTKSGGRKDDGVGGNGDLLLTTTGASSGNTYSIRVQFRVK